jgi:WD40 repeat protein
MAFDPYDCWLGIPADRRPPTHYDLLGLAPFESDPEVIEQAALRRMSRVRQHQIGPYSDQSQEVLAELARARLILMDRDRRAEYDANLRARAGGDSGSSTAPDSLPNELAAPRPSDPFEGLPAGLASLDLTDEKADGSLAAGRNSTKARSPWNRRLIIGAIAASHVVVFCAFVVFVFPWLGKEKAADPVPHNPPRLTSTPKQKPTTPPAPKRSSPRLDPKPDIETKPKVPVIVEQRQADTFGGEVNPTDPKGTVAQKADPQSQGMKESVQAVASNQNKSNQKGRRQPLADAVILKPTMKFRPLRGHKKDVWRVAFSPDRMLLASGGEDGEVIVWDMATGQELRRLHREILVYGLTFAPTVTLGRVLISGRTGFGGIVTLENLDNGAIEHFQIRAGWRRLSVAISPESRFLAAADDMTLRIWDHETVMNFRRQGDKDVREYFEFNPPAALPAEIFCIAFRPRVNRPQIAVGCRNGDVRLFRIGNLSPNGVLPDAIKVVGHQGAVHCVQYNPDGSLLATTGEDGAIRIWDAQGKQVRLIPAIGRPVNWLAYSPNGNLLASAHDDNSVRVWDTRNWGDPKVLTDHTAPVLGVDISSDSRYLASCSRDFTVIVYDLNPKAPVSGKKGRRK